MSEQNINANDEPGTSGMELRDAKEVFLFMNKKVRISRDLRARWFFEHLNSSIAIDGDTNENEGTSDTFGVAVMGMIPKTGPPVRPNERLRITTNTHITYFSKFYSLVFILDFSPSCFVSDDSGCVLYNKLVESVVRCIKNITKTFKFTGSDNVYMPQIYASFCAFTPFLCFPENSVLLQSILLSQNNVENVIGFLKTQIKSFIDKLCVFAQPHMKEWNRRRRIMRRTNDENFTNLFQQANNTPDENTSPMKSLDPNNTSEPALKKKQEGMSDQGFIQPDWALIFMLRMGLMSAQMCLADNIQSNIVIVTDGVCGIPDSQALQSMLAQLRSSSISCSFIQLNQTLRGPALGHVGFPELLHFLATATFGHFLTESQLDEFSTSSSTYNNFHRSFLAWSFQRALIRNNILPELVLRGLRTTHIRNRRMSRVYETTLCRLLYVRLREGYTIKHLEVQKHGEDFETIFVKMSLLWKPQTTIDYIITGPWNGNPKRICKLQVDVFVDAIVNATAELAIELQNADAVKSAILSISDADCLMLHLNLFNCDLHYFKLPKEFDENIPFFEYRKNVPRPILNQRYENLKNTKFISFWQPLCVLDERIWQKWAHTHTIRAVLNYDFPLPEKLFTPSHHKFRYADVSSEMAFQTLHTALREISTFTLIKEEFYVTMLYENSVDHGTPKYFYIIRASVDMPFVILKVAFLGGVPGQIRKKIISDIKGTMDKLRITRESMYINSVNDTSFSSPSRATAFQHSFPRVTSEKAVIVIAKPLERTLVKYRKTPKNLYQLVRLERSEKLRDNREMILHNAITKYLTCKRQIWQLRGVFLKNVAISSNSLEFIMQTLLRKRLNQGFYIAYNRGGIVNLVRQREAIAYKNDSSHVEQCVLLGPTFVEESSEGASEVRKGRKISLSMEDESRVATLDSNNANAYFTQIVVEHWTEPRDCVDELQMKERNSSRLVAENGIIIRTLFTFEQWQNACASRILLEEPAISRALEVGASTEISEQSAVNKCMTFNGIESPRSTIECIRDAYNLQELLNQANEKEIVFLPALGYSINDSQSNTRLSILLARLQSELAQSYDACIDVPDESVPRCIRETARSSFANVNVVDSELSTSFEREYNQTNNEPKDSNISATIEQSPPQISSQLYSPTLRCGSVSPPPSSNSSTSFHFEKSTADEKPKKNLLFPLHQENADNSSYLDTLCEHRSTSVPLLSSTDKDATLNVSNELGNRFLPPNAAASRAHGGSAFEPVAGKNVLSNWNYITNKTRPTTTTPFLEPTTSASNIIGNAEAISESMVELKNDEKSSTKKKHSSTFSNDELSFNDTTRISLRVPTKKFSAPPSSVKRKHAGSTNNDDNVQNVVQPLAQWKLFVKRLNNYRLIFLMVPKNVMAIRIFSETALENNTFPIFAFHCDKARIAQHLASNDFDLLAGVDPESVLIENFCRKPETSTLAYLQQQIKRRAKREARKEANAHLVMESYYVNAVSMDANNSNGAMMSDEQKLGDVTDDGAYTTFDLANYCELVFEEYIYTKCCIATVYACLGQEIFVPASVLQETMDYRCEHIRVEIGSINEILDNTCTHMKQDETKFGNFNDLTKPKKKLFKRRKTQKLFSSSSSLSSTESADAIDSDTTDQKLGKRSHRASYSLEVLFKVGNDISADGEEINANNQMSILSTTSSHIEAICEDELSGFRQSFDDLLKQYSFAKVSGLDDYFFYWPRSTYLTNQQKMLDHVIEDMSYILVPGSASYKKLVHQSGNSNNRHMSLSQYSRRHSSIKVVNQKIVADSKSIDGDNNAFIDEFSNESSDVGGCYDDGSDESSENEKYNFVADANGIFEFNNWPLFIQFSASVYVNGQVLSVAIESVPNCLKEILDKCTSAQDHEFDNLSNVEASIEMYVFTWPLPSQCSYKECLEFFGNSEVAGTCSKPLVNEEGISTTIATSIATTTNASMPKCVDTDGMTTSTSVATDMTKTFKSSMSEYDETDHKDSQSVFHFPQALNCYSAFAANEGDELFQQPVEVLRQIPEQDRRLLRKIQRSIQRMLKMEYILLISREFETRPQAATIRRVMRFITEEIGHSNKFAELTRSGDRRCALLCKELIIVSDAQFGLNQLYERLENLKIDYCTLKRFCASEKNNDTNVTQSPRRIYSKRVSRFLHNEKSAKSEQEVIFYACRMDNINDMPRSNIVAQKCDNFINAEDSECLPFRESFTNEIKEKMLSGSSIITFSHSQNDDERVTHSSSSATISAMSYEAMTTADDFDNAAPVSAASCTDDDEIHSDITMPLNDMEQQCLSINARINNALTTKTKPNQDNIIHDFWLIVHIEHKANEGAQLKIYFCNRSPSIHSDLFTKACQLINEQIKVVNQTLLLEKMHRTEECDPLLVDSDNVVSSQQLPPYVQSHSYQNHNQLHQHQTHHSTRNQSGQHALHHHYYNHHHHHHHHHHHRPSQPIAQSQPDSYESPPKELLVEGGSVFSRHAAKFVQWPTCTSQRAKNAKHGQTSSTVDNNGSFSPSDEEEVVDEEGDIADLVRYKYGPGYFACDMKWHCWFPIHRRLRSTGIDNGFVGLRVGLEQLAVRNRSNMYVYREKSKNIVYMRLYSNADSVFANIPIKSESWRNEVLANIGHSVLLAVHGVNPPGDEITIQLRNVLQRRLNKKTLEEIQNALLKNAHIRLEWSDIKFIQNDPQHPDSICYFTIPSVAQKYLLAVKHYFTQQLQTFCILPKFREQSGMFGGQHTGHHLPPFHALKSHSSSGDFSTTAASLCGSGAGGVGSSGASSLASYSAATTANCCGWDSYANADSVRRSQPTSGLSTPPPSITAPIASASFVPCMMENMPPNPKNYVPSFFLFNKPAGEGKRDTGIACLEMKLVDWKNAIIEDLREAGFSPTTRSLLYPSIPNADRRQRAERFQMLSKCIQIQQLADTTPVPGTCALFQFNIWKNGNVEMEELQARLKMCAQQAISDLITEYGLLSTPIFETAFRSNTNSFPVSKSMLSSADVAEKQSDFTSAKFSHLQRQNAQDIENRQNITGSSKVLFDIATAPILKTHLAGGTNGKRSVTIEGMSNKTQNIRPCDSVESGQSSVHQNIELNANISITQRATVADNATLSTNVAVVGDQIQPAQTLQKQQQKILLKQDSQLSTELMGQSGGLYQYLQKTAKPNIANQGQQSALAYAMSSVSPFAFPSQTLLDGIDGTGTSVQVLEPDVHNTTGGSIGSDGIENLLFEHHQYQTQQLQQHPQNRQQQQQGHLYSSLLAQTQTHQQRTLQTQLQPQQQQLNFMDEYLRVDFVAAAADWFDRVYSTTKGFPEMSHSVRKFNFLLDCDGSARKIIQVIYERLKQMLRSEKVTLCRSSTAHNTGKHLQTILSVTPLLEPFEKDFGRMVFMDEEYTTELVLVAYPERQFLDTLHYGHDLSAPVPNALHKLVMDSTQSGSYSKFLSSLKPFVPRQRVLYLLLNDENITLFLYNYTNEIVLRVKEVVERAILWHNARSRLLREIGLHKMGITHLSTLKSMDSKFNSYLLLTWLNPEMLVRNDYPVENLTTPDFTKLPRNYAQLLLKLYRFSDPAFVAKNLNVFPFEDQTQQMLTLREDIRSMLNEHRIFYEIHKQLINQRFSLSQDFFNRIISRSRQVHYVQSPLLLFPNWRRIVASIRSGNDVSQRSGAKPSSWISSISTNKIRSKTIGTDASIGQNEELCLRKIKQMLIDDYVTHLRMMGLDVLNIIQSKQRDNALSRSVHYETTSGDGASLNSGGSVGSRAQYQASVSTSDDASGLPELNNVCLCVALAGGILFVQASFVEPYFCVRIFQWNNLQLVTVPNSPNSKAEAENLKQLEKKKNELIRKCHVHSFTYDFHLRVVSRYLTGGKQILFNAGYNTNAFLADFLQYYECRPPNARNCLYEETLKRGQLQVNQSTIWEYFLDNKTQFAWNVVRLKMVDSNANDEFMLVSKNETQLLGQQYKLVRIVLSNNNYHGHQHKQEPPSSGSAQSVSSNTRDYEITLKFYVLLVNEDRTYPISNDLKQEFNDEDSKTTTRDRNHNSSGEFTRICKSASNAPISSAIIEGQGCESNFAFNQNRASFNQHYRNHRNAVGAKFSYCCDLAADAPNLSSCYINNEETLIEDVGVSRIRAASVVERCSSNDRDGNYQRQSKGMSSTNEIGNNEDVRFFLTDYDNAGRKRFSSGGNLEGKHAKSRMSKPTSYNRRISDAPSILSTSLSVALPNLSRFLLANTSSSQLDDSISAAVAIGKNVMCADNEMPLSQTIQLISPPERSDSPTAAASLSSNNIQRQSNTEISFQKIPPRRHRYGHEVSLSFHEGGAVVPSEQIVYLHYFSSVQRKLQISLEHIVDEKRTQLMQFVHEADRLCYIDMLWRSLLSSKSTHIRRQPTTLFSTATISRSDLSTSCEPSTAALHKSLKLSGSMEMDPADFAALLNIVRVEPMQNEEPRLHSLLAEVNFGNLCRFLLQYYEGENRCRYFVYEQKSYLIITNPSYLDSAAMFRNDSNTTELFLLFKNANFSRIENEPFSTNAIHKLFENVISCVSAFVWSDLLNNLPLS